MVQPVIPRSIASHSIYVVHSPPRILTFGWWLGSHKRQPPVPVGNGRNGVVFYNFKLQGIPISLFYLYMSVDTLWFVSSSWNGVRRTTVIPVIIIHNDVDYYNDVDDHDGDDDYGEGDDDHNDDGNDDDGHDCDHDHDHDDGDN